MAFQHMALVLGAFLAMELELEPDLEPGLELDSEVSSLGASVPSLGSWGGRSGGFKS